MKRKRIARFIVAAPQGRAHGAAVTFACNTCSREYVTMPEAIRCWNTHRAQPYGEEFLKEVISITLHDFNVLKSSDFLCTMIIQGEANVQFSLKNSSELVEALSISETWLLKKEYGKLTWNIFQYLSLLVAWGISTAGVAISGYNRHYTLAIVVILSLIAYTRYYWGYRQLGQLGEPLPIIPWRTAVAMLIVSIVCFIGGMVASLYV